MNTSPEPDKLTRPFTKKENSSFFSSGLLFVVMGLIALLIYSFYDRGESTTLKSTKPDKTHKTSSQNQDKARQKELIAYIQQHPDEEFAHFQLGQLIQKRAPFQALENYSHVTPRHPRYYDAVKAIADIAREQDLPAQAKPALLKLVRKYPQESQYFEDLARLLFQEGNYGRALKYASRSIELGENRVQNYLLLADILRQAGRITEMPAPLKQALYLDPESYQAHLSLAYAALYSGDLKTAERETQWCLEQKPDAVIPIRYLASINQNRGEIDEALSHLEQALQIDPQDLECLLLKADLLMFQKRGQQAYDLLKPFYSKWETNRRYITALARAAGSIGRREEAGQLQEKNQQLIKADDLKPSSLQGDAVKGFRSLTQ
ncbi:MAG: tetratricopeptide repeat protein [Gimesia sp.]